MESAGYLNDVRHSQSFIHEHSSSMNLGGGRQGDDSPNAGATTADQTKQIKIKMLKPLHFDKHQVTCFDILDAFFEVSNFY